MVFLQGHGVSSAYAVRIFRQYGKDSIAKVKENPYCLADDVFGIGFRMADRIAQTLGYMNNDLRRCKAGVIYTLKQMAGDGHCFMERSELVKSTVTLLEVSESSVNEAVDGLAFKEDVIIEDNNVFLPMYYYSEKGVAKRVGHLWAMRAT